MIVLIYIQHYDSIGKGECSINIDERLSIAFLKSKMNHGTSENIHVLTKIAWNIA